MLKSAKPERDPFTFSLKGMAAINSYAVPPVVANDHINKALDRQRLKEANRRDLAIRIEDALARYFAPLRT